MKLNESIWTGLKIGPNNPNHNYILNHIKVSGIFKPNDLGVMENSFFHILSCKARLFDQNYLLTTTILDQDWTSAFQYVSL